MVTCAKMATSHTDTHSHIPKSVAISRHAGHGFEIGRIARAKLRSSRKSVSLPRHSQPDSLESAPEAARVGQSPTAQPPNFGRRLSKIGRHRTLALGREVLGVPLAFGEDLLPLYGFDTMGAEFHPTALSRRRGEGGLSGTSAATSGFGGFGFGSEVAGSRGARQGGLQSRCAPRVCGCGSSRHFQASGRVGSGSGQGPILGRRPGRSMANHGGSPISRRSSQKRDFQCRRRGVGVSCVVGVNAGFRDGGLAAGISITANAHASLALVLVWWLLIGVNAGVCSAPCLDASAGVSLGVGSGTCAGDHVGVLDDRCQRCCRCQRRVSPTLVMVAPSAVGHQQQERFRAD